MKCKNHIDSEATGACMHCGNLFCESCLVELNGKKYCKEHVATVINDINSKSASNETINKNDSKSHIKKAWHKPAKIVGAILSLIIIAFIAILLLNDYSYEKIVKNGYLPEHKDVTIGNAYKNFFGKNKWRYFPSENDNDKHIVEFTGLCYRNKKEAKVTIQFEVNKSTETFKVTYFAYDDEKSNPAVFEGVMDKVFISYKNPELDKEIQDMIANDNGKTMDNIAKGLTDRLVQSGEIDESSVIKKESNESIPANTKEFSPDSNYVIPQAPASIGQGEAYARIKLSDAAANATEEELTQSVKNAVFKGLGATYSLETYINNYFTDVYWNMEISQEVAISGKSNIDGKLYKLVVQCDNRNNACIYSAIKQNSDDTSDITDLSDQDMFNLIYDIIHK